MTDNPKEQMPCANGCIVEGTENNDKPSLMIATHGQFCKNEYRAINGALKLAPNLVEHVLSLLNAKGGNDDRVDSSRDSAPLPMNMQAFTDANETYQRLVFWARVWADEMGLQAPGPAVHAWRNRSGVIVGLPANITPSSARYIVGVMGTWLRIQLDNIMALGVEDVLAFRDDLKDVYRVNARWPQKQRPRYSDMPCPVQGCGQRLAVFPPEDFGDDERIVCDGGHHIPPQRYEFYVNFYAQVKAEPDPRKRHLMKKYGRTA